MKKLLLTLIMLGVVFSVNNCTEASLASHNLSKAAEEFQITRRIVFFNGITDTYLLSVEGRCSLEHQRSQLEVTCKIGQEQFKKHHLGLSDNVSYFSEQLKTVNVDTYHYKIIFRPSVMIPDVDVK